MADVDDHSWDWANNAIEANYSSCGSFCFLDYGVLGVLMLDSTCLKKRQANLQIPAVWDFETSYNGRLYKVDEDRKSATVDLYQAFERSGRNGLHDSLYAYEAPEFTIAAKITAFPAHLAPAYVCLLVGKCADDLVRVLFFPYSGKGPPEIKHLRVTLNQILAKMEDAARAVELKMRDRRYDWYQWSEGESSVLEWEENNEVESEEVAMSADEDEWESHETD